MIARLSRKKNTPISEPPKIIRKAKERHVLETGRITSSRLTRHFSWNDPGHDEQTNEKMLSFIGKKRGYFP